MDISVYSEADSLAHFPGVPQFWTRYIGRTLHYPDSAVNDGLQGDIAVQFIIEADCKLSEFHAMTGPQGGGLRKEAEWVIRMSCKWIPAMVGGRAVRSYKWQLINFRMQLDRKSGPTNQFLTHPQS